MTRSRRDAFPPCSLGHTWDGCKCKECGATRDEGHDWEIRTDCSRCCRRCYAMRNSEHSWEGCRCTHCGRTRHEWQQSVCTHCGQPCEHLEKSPYWKIVTTGQTAYADKTPICQACGLHLESVCRSVTRDLSSLNPIAPSPNDLATDPLWQALRSCWQIVERARFRSLTLFDEASQRSRESRFLVLEHEEALKALVSLRQLEAPVAAGIQRAFNQTVYHIQASRASCYIAMPREAKWRDDLLEQLAALGDLALLGSLQPATVKRAAEAIAHDIDLLKETDSQNHWPKPFGTVCNETEAARIVIKMLLHNPEEANPALGCE